MHKAVATRTLQFYLAQALVYRRVHPMMVAVPRAVPRHHRGLSAALGQ